MGRTTLLIRSKWNWLLGKAENHGEQLDYSYEQMLRDLKKAQVALRDIVAVKHRSMGQVGVLREKVETLDTQSHRAMQAGREDLAGQLVQSKIVAQAQLERSARRVLDLNDEQHRLENGVRVLQFRVADMKDIKEELKAKLLGAEAKARMGAAVAGLSNSSSDAQRIIERAQDQISTKEAEASAVDELVSRGVFTDSLMPGSGIEKQLYEIDSQHQFEIEMQKLRLELPAATEEAPKEVTSGN